MPKAFPKQVREDVIRVYRDFGSSVAQVAKDFGISPSCLKRLLTIDDRRLSGSEGGMKGPWGSGGRVTRSKPRYLL